MSMNPAKNIAMKGLDALVVGAGFAGIYHLHHLRKLGFAVKLFEAGSDIGGSWYWNCYPGARTDSDFTIYQFAMEDLWKNFTFSEMFPNRSEIMKYFHYVEKKLDLRRDMVFDTCVVSATFNADTDRWAVTTDTGITVHPRFLVLCIGWAAKPALPEYKGLDTFKGACYHTARWPQNGVELRNKRIGTIGTGSTGVQVIQEVAKEAAHLTVFLRTPPIAFPMRQHPVDEKMQKKWKDLMPYILRRRQQTRGGTSFESIPKSIMEVTPEERILTLEELWNKGNFHSFLGSFKDIYTSKQANNMVYEFWRDKVRERIDDPVVQEKLAPLTAWCAIAARRHPCLERGFYEAFNRPNVGLVDLKENPIAEITPGGVRMSDGTEHSLDVLVLATGYDAITGPMKQIDIRGKDGTLIRDKWEEKGLLTYLGLMSAGYPNMFFPFGPQAPTGNTNGPSTIEFQGAWIVECLQHMRKNGLTRIEPTREAEEGWRELTQELYSMGVGGQESKSTTGKLGESRNFAGGLLLYSQKCRESAENGYKGFVFSGVKKGVMSRL
ncbi:FAD/NAD(P)-binding domain-containing protein [Tricholoma matsutake]|nr:FAD/NAD(P)-binding domain-containing protein [Tricholoma matsutake 945]